jgi:hypothetical protein
MSFRGGVSEKRRVHLQLPSELEQAVRTVGQEHGLRLGPALRMVLRRGLDGEHAIESCRDCPTGLAALVAAEQTLLLVASILPQGRSLVGGLAAEAVAAAEQRLSLVGRGGAASEVAE